MNKIKIITISLICIDFLSTIYGLLKGFTESNPLGFLYSTMFNIFLIICIICYPEEKQLMIINILATIICIYLIIIKIDAIMNNLSILLNV